MLQPYVESGVSIARQQKIFETIIRNPLESYVFSGPPGVGKTTLLRELENLARVARPKNFAIYSKTAAQYQAMATSAARGEYVRGLIRPSYFATDAVHGMKWGLYLDDVDKISNSEFIKLQMFELLNEACADDVTTQLVLTTNMRKEEFAKFFGDAIAWRVFKKCTWVSMERETVAA